jgi:hypothetical protein
VEVLVAPGKGLLILGAEIVTVADQFTPRMFKAATENTIKAKAKYIQVDMTAAGVRKPKRKTCRKTKMLKTAQPMASKPNGMSRIAYGKVMKIV